MDLRVYRFLVRLLDRWLDRLTGTTSWREPEPKRKLRCLCPICRGDVRPKEPHLHDQVVVRATDWPEPGTIVTVEPVDVA